MSRNPAQLTGLDGTFTLRGLAGDALDLEVSYHATDPGGAPLYLRAWSRGLRPPRSDVEVVLPRNLGVEGVLLGERDEPLAGVTVRARDADGRLTTAASDAQGRFRVAAAEGEHVDLSLAGPEPAPDGAAPGLEAELRGVSAGTTGVVLRARGALSLRAGGPSCRSGSPRSPGGSPRRCS
jgi:hypothetical protein